MIYYTVGSTRRELPHVQGSSDIMAMKAASVAFNELTYAEQLNTTAMIITLDCNGSPLGTFRVNVEMKPRFSVGAKL